MTAFSFKKLDYILILLALLLLFAGLIAIYSATYISGQGQSDYFTRQLYISLSGFVLMVGLAFVPFRLIQKSAYIFYIFSIFLLILVYFVGVKGFGVERWLMIAGIKIQPSEFAKLATILAVAYYISRPESDINRFRDFTVVTAIIILPMVLIARQPDLGTAFVFISLLVPLLFWAGLNWFILFIIISPLFTILLSFSFYAFLIWMLLISAVLYLSRRKIVILVSIFLLHIFVGLATPAMWASLKPYQQQRILTFANPESDPRGAGYQIIQSKVALGSGGIWGKGFLNGSQTQLKFLPAQHTDFIFSVIGEEWGLFGVNIILLLFSALLLYLLHLSVQVRSQFASMTIIGITTVLFFHIFVNIGMTIGLAPVTGLPLPFISYGGSFLLVMLIMMGIVLNFSLNRYKQ